MTSAEQSLNVCTDESLRVYYRWHSHIYDATRWSFLFGRAGLVNLAAKAAQAKGWQSPQILEVGCGTGKNLGALARALPRSDILGIDLCSHMLARAARSQAVASGLARITLGAYAKDSLAENSQDIVVFSYALSMFNPGFEAALDAARLHLRPGGIIAVADFESSPFAWFRAWMGVNHVRLDGQLLPALAARFAAQEIQVRRAYAGIWKYFLYLGRKA